MPNTEKCEPIRAKDLKEIEEPRCKKSMTDKVDPSRAKLRIDIAEPICT
jgi:hypothetical protein